MSALNRDTGIHSVEQLGEKIATLQELRAKAGRSGPFDIAIGPKAKIGYGKSGGADAYLEAVGELAEAGVTWAMAEPPHANAEGRKSTVSMRDMVVSFVFVNGAF